MLAICCCALFHSADSAERFAFAYFGPIVLALAPGTPSGVPAGHTELAEAMAHIMDRSRHTKAEVRFILPARKEEGNKPKVSLVSWVCRSMVDNLHNYARMQSVPVSIIHVSCML
jgi:hypothetical protein